MADTKTKVKTNASQKKIIVIAAALLLIGAIGGGTFFVVKNNKAEIVLPTTAPITSELQTTQEETTVAPTAKDINPLTGLAGFDANNYGKRPIAVVVENSPAARPQWGLCSPDIVIEGVVEGGITRMLWLYADVNTIPKVGPIRSARHDFVEMAEGLDAVFVHWGGSNPAYLAIMVRKVDTIDGMTYSGKYFFRENSRNAPHNGYTTGESIAKALNNLNINTQINPTYNSPFMFSAQGTPTTPAGGTCQSISLAFSSSYKHEFQFNSTEKLYYNLMNSKPMLEDGGKQMAVTNVIIIYCPLYKNAMDPGNMEMDLIRGTGVFASNGGYENITWKKGEPNETMKFYSADGSEIMLNAGKSYIGLVPIQQSGSTVVS